MKINTLSITGAFQNLNLTTQVDPGAFQNLPRSTQTAFRNWAEFNDQVEPCRYIVKISVILSEKLIHTFLEREKLSSEF